jgi:hypothetical protein
MLQIRLTESDISRTRFGVSPLLQAVFVSLRPVGRETDETRQRYRRLLRGLSSSAVPFVGLLRDGVDLPDFLTPPPPPGHRHDLQDALDIVDAVPQWRIVEDLQSMRSPSSAAQALIDGGSTALRSLRSALVTVHGESIGKDADDVRRILEAEVARRAVQMATYGVDHVLSTLHPMLMWRNPVITVHCVRNGPELQLAGHGLVLVPSLGRDFTVMTTINPWEPAVLAYPVNPGAERRAELVAVDLDPEAPPRALADLIGRTRARVLLAVNASAASTTSQIAARCAISVSSASEHTGVLRRAGMVASFRRREAVLHSITPLGERTATGDRHLGQLTR